MKDNYVREVELMRVVDGDTVDLHKYMGERVIKEDRYRLLGIDTPERGQEGFQEATDYLLYLLNRSSKLYGRTEKHGKFRWLIELFDQDGNNINLMMIEHGYAVPYEKNN